MFINHKKNKDVSVLLERIDSVAPFGVKNVHFNSQDFDKLRKYFNGFMLYRGIKINRIV